MIERRDFLRAMLVAAAGPMIVRASSLMPIRALAPEIVFPAVGSWGPVHRWIVTSIISPEGRSPYVETKFVPVGGPLNYGGATVYNATTWGGSHGFRVGDFVELGKAPPAEASGVFEVDIKIT